MSSSDGGEVLEVTVAGERAGRLVVPSCRPFNVFTPTPPPPEVVQLQQSLLVTPLALEGGQDRVLGLNK